MSHLYCHWQVFVDETFLLGFHEKLFWVTETNQNFRKLHCMCMVTVSALISPPQNQSVMFPTKRDLNLRQLF